MPAAEIASQSSAICLVRWPNRSGVADLVDRSTEQDQRLLLIELARYERRTCCPVVQGPVHLGVTRRSAFLSCRPTPGSAVVGEDAIVQIRPLTLIPGSPHHPPPPTPPVPPQSSEPTVGPVGSRPRSPRPLPPARIRLRTCAASVTVARDGVRRGVGIGIHHGAGDDGSGGLSRQRSRLASGRSGPRRHHPIAERTIRVQHVRWPQYTPTLQRRLRSARCRLNTP